MSDPLCHNARAVNDFKLFLVETVGAFKKKKKKSRSFDNAKGMFVLLLRAIADQDYHGSSEIFKLYFLWLTGMKIPPTYGIKSSTFYCLQN